MKKFIISALLACAVCGLSSCEDFLTQSNPNKIGVDQYFSTENDVDRALAGAYMAIRSNDCMGEGSTAYTEERSDNTGRVDNQSAAGEPFQFTNFAVLPSNTYLKKHWVALFQAVNDANFAIKGVNTVAFADAEKQTNVMAEARFVRALVYFDIVRKWGDAPLVTEYLATPADVKSNTFRSPKAQVYEQIVEDLKFGMDNSTLPDHQPEGLKGRASKAAIAGLLGKVYLTMAQTLDAARKQEYLNAAKTCLEQCMAMKKFGSLSEITYDDNAATGLYAVANKSRCPEILFQIVYKQGDKDYHSSIAETNQAIGVTVCTQFPSKGKGTYVNQDLVNEYEAGDLRKDYSVVYASNSKALCWSITKFRDRSDAAGTLAYGGNDWIILRYADVMLMLAECYEQLGQDAKAIEYLDQVRSRAGLPAYAESVRNTDYKTKFPTLRMAIMHERRVELAFENQRWYDLLRFMSASQLVDFFHAKKQTEYGISNLQNFTKKDIYYPIPFDEWKLNPEKMYQNEGY